MAAHRVDVRRLDTLETVRISTLELLPAVEEHIAALGLLDRFAVHVADEPIAENVESYRQLSAEVRRRAPRLRRIDAIHVPQLSGSLEVWVPQINYFEKWLAEFRAAQQAGNELWFYVAWVPQGGYTNRMIDSSAIKPRLLHWLNALYGTQGYLHWALNHWQIPLTSLESPGDQYICWPSRRFVANSSLRYEAERDGMEEAELLGELGSAGTPAERSHGAVTDFTHYTRSWEELERARRRLLAELERRHRQGGAEAAP